MDEQAIKMACDLEARLSALDQLDETDGRPFLSEGHHPKLLPVRMLAKGEYLRGADLQ